MSNIIVPSLSDDNLISEPLLKLDTLYAYFLASDYSQSNIYSGNISSMKYLFEKFGDDIQRLVNEVDSTLDTYLKRYFVEVTLNVFYDEENNAINVAIVVVDDDGARVELNNTLGIANGKLDAYSAISDILIR